LLYPKGIPKREQQPNFPAARHSSVATQLKKREHGREVNNINNKNRNLAQGSHCRARLGANFYGN